MKTIGIICSSLTRNGAERVAVILANFFSQHNRKCKLITLQDSMADEYSLPDNIERYCAGGRTILGLRKAIIQSNADILLVMDTPMAIFAIPACIGLKKKIIVSERSDPVHCNQKRITKILSRFFMKYANGFIFQTVESKQFYDEYLHGRGIVIANPLRIDQLPSPYAEIKREKNIVGVGRLIESKNYTMLIKAYDRIRDEFPEYNLIIYGEGGYRSKLKKISDEFGITDNVIMPGNKVDVLERIRTASLFVMPSDYEGMPNALIEAMALGLPCISTDCPCGGPRSLIKNGENGILVPVDDVDAMANAIRALLRNPDKAEKIGRNAIKLRDLLDSEKVGQQWMDYLENC